MRRGHPITSGVPEMGSPHPGFAEVRDDILRMNYIVEGLVLLLSRVFFFEVLIMAVVLRWAHHLARGQRAE